MGETPLHILNMRYVLEPLDRWFDADPMTFVAGNMFVHYVPNDRNRHVSPDVFVVRGIPKEREPRRRAYLVWEEGKGPDFVVEFTSRSTREEDLEDKMALYRDVLRVREYFLYDPYAEHLDPVLRGYRLAEGVYQPIEPVEGRLPSEVVGLHLEDGGDLLRLYDPATRRWLPTPAEVSQALQLAEAARLRDLAAIAEAEAGRRREQTARERAENENERLRREIEELRRGTPPGSP
jgi:Uma2 family endonuclease